MGLVEALALERHLAGGTLGRELDVGTLNVGSRQLGRLQPLDLFAARRDLTRARAGTEPRDEVVQLRDLLLALRVVGFDRRPNLHLGEHHVVVAAGIRDDRLIVDIGDVRAHLVEEMPVVRDDDERAVVALEERLQPMDRIEVEVVRRFVEQQRFGTAVERLGEEHTNLLAALQLGHLPLVERVRNVETLEKYRRVALRRVAVLFADDTLELAQSHPIVVRHVRLGVELVAFLERVPQPLVAHDDGVDDAILVERVLILAQHTELAWPHDRAALRLGLARQQLHERGFSRAVRARQAVATARRERCRDILEEDLRPEPH